MLVVFSSLFENNSMKIRFGRYQSIFSLVKNGTFQLFQKINDITSNIEVNILEKQPVEISSVTLVKGMIWKKVLQPSPHLKECVAQEKQHLAASTCSEMVLVSYS